MAGSHEEKLQTLAEICRARDQAASLRDQLTAEYHRLEEDHREEAGVNSRDKQRRELGREAMRKAIAAADRAIASIDQALREMGHLHED